MKGHPGKHRKRTERRYEDWDSLREVLRYEWRMRCTFHRKRAMIRGLFNSLIRRYACELCQDCGTRVGWALGDSSWFVENWLWQKVTGGPGGLLCASCFTLRARDLGIGLRWQAVPDELEGAPDG